MITTPTTTSPMTTTSRGPVMLDLDGQVLTQDDRRRLRHPLTGAVILFARNFRSRRQLTALVNDIREVRPECLIAVDHEGGRVQRFKTDGFTHLPTMASLGALWNQGDTESRWLALQRATAIGYILAAELRACGIDLSFTPVLDLDWGRSQVIGDRAFHADPHTVALLAKNLCHGLSLAGMSNCGKHFPGHGWAEADSHVDIPVDERSLEEILRDDAAPYRWLGLELGAVMPAHVIYPRIDNAPAGFSRRWIQDILRDRLRFAGAVFSDDLAMAGARVAGDVVSAAQAALGAGCDIVLVCNQPASADTLLDRLEPTSSLESARRIAALMPQRPFLNWEELQESESFRHALRTLKLKPD